MIGQGYIFMSLGDVYVVYKMRYKIYRYCWNVFLPSIWGIVTLYILQACSKSVGHHDVYGTVYAYRAVWSVWSGIWRIQHVWPIWHGVWRIWRIKRAWRCLWCIWRGVWRKWRAWHSLWLIWRIWRIWYVWRGVWRKWRIWQIWCVWQVEMEPS